MGYTEPNTPHTEIPNVRGVGDLKIKIVSIADLIKDANTFSPEPEKLIDAISANIFGAIGYRLNIPLMHQRVVAGAATRTGYFFANKIVGPCCPGASYIQVVETNVGNYAFENRGFIPAFPILSKSSFVEGFAVDETGTESVRVDSHRHFAGFIPGFPYQIHHVKLTVCCGTVDGEAVPDSLGNKIWPGAAEGHVIKCLGPKIVWTIDFDSNIWGYYHLLISPGDGTKIERSSKIGGPTPPFPLAR